MIARPDCGSRATRVLRFAFAIGVAGSAGLWSSPSHAQSAADSATAQALFERAKRLIADGNYADACPLLEESERVEQRSGTRLNLADCYERTGRYASAWSMFLNAAALAKGNNPERESVARERASQLVPKLSNLVISAPPAAPPELEIMRDGTKVGGAQLGVPMPADGGTHTVEARAPGKKTWRTQVTLKASGQTLKVEVPNLEDAPAGAPATEGASPAPDDAPREAAPRSEPSGEAPSRFTTGVIVGLAVTGALGVGTVVTGILYNSKNNEYDAANQALEPDREDLRKQVNTLGVVNLALLGGTVVSAGVTTLLWALGPQKPTTSASVQVGAFVTPELAFVSAQGRL